MQKGAEEGQLKMGESNVFSLFFFLLLFPSIRQCPEVELAT
jgi:hypothetical protein